MAVPLEDYTVREKGIVSYDTLKSVAKEYGTTAQALKYFNRNSPYYDEIKKLNTGEGLFNFASKIDPAKIPKLKVPEIPTGGNTTNKTVGSVSSSSYNSIISKRIILKRINASYGTALKNNIPFLREDRNIRKYLASSNVQKYIDWEPLYTLHKSFYDCDTVFLKLRNNLIRQNQFDDATKKRWERAYQDEMYTILMEHRNYYAKVLRVEKTEADRIKAFDINNSTNTGSDDDKKKVLAIIEKIVDMTAHEDSYGHWWLEIYKADINLPEIAGDKSALLYETVAPKNLKASYGFWPLDSAGLFGGAVTGSVPGGINNCRGPNATNLFNIDEPQDQFDPYANNDSISWKVDNAYFVTDPYGRSEDEIYNDIVEYLKSYPKDRRWAWPDTDEDQEHCQTFQKELLAACGLVAAPKIEKDQYPPLDKYKVFWGYEELTATDTKPSPWTP